MIEPEDDALQPPAPERRGAALKRTALRLLLRLGLLLALIASALGGAILATELRPATQVVAARTHLPPKPTRVIPTATPVPTPAAPARALLGPADGHATPDGAWLASRTATLRITLTGGQAAGAIRAEAEVLPADVPFTGTPNAASGAQNVLNGGVARVQITVANLTDGQRYHWRVRAHVPGGMVSPWSGGGVFGVSVSNPLPPQLATTNVQVGGWSTIVRPLFRWTDAGSRAPIAFYEYAVTPASAGTMQVNWQHAHGAVLALPRWAEGDWQLLVRAVDLAGNRSRPAAWSFGLARSAPAAPRIVAADPAQDTWSNLATATVRWAGASSIAPIRTYQYRIGPAGDPSGMPHTWTSIAGASLSLPNLPDGDWTAQIRAVDQAGLISPPVHWTFHLDRERPLLTAPVLSTQNFTPPAERLHLRFGLGKESTLSFSVYAAGKSTPIFTHSLGLHEPGLVRGLMWDGRLSAKHMAPAGIYAIVVDAVDRAGNRTEMRSAPITILDKWILVSIHKDTLWAYQGDKLVQTTLVTNGGPDTPTLPGIFHVQVKYRGWVMHSPWPKSSPYWYPDSPTTFALLYNAAGGYFLHDAPWRYNFGPGSNSVAGTPGGSYTGTHGCTNVPFDAMAKLFDWADQGTLIKIVR